MREAHVLRFHWHQPNRWPISYIYPACPFTCRPSRRLLLLELTLRETRNLSKNLSNIYSWYSFGYTTKFHSYQTRRDFLFIFLMKNVGKHEGLSDCEMFRSAFIRGRSEFCYLITSKLTKCSVDSKEQRLIQHLVNKNLFPCELISCVAEKKCCFDSSKLQLIRFAFMHSTVAHIITLHLNKNMFCCHVNAFSPFFSVLNWFSCQISHVEVAWLEIYAWLIPPFLIAKVRLNVQRDMNCHRKCHFRQYMVYLYF